MRKGFAPIILIVGILPVLVITYQLLKPKTQTQNPVNSQQAVSSPSPTPFVFRTYTPPKIEKKNTYTIFMIGDSMTLALGPHGGTFNQFINELYKKDKRYVLIDNYAKGSTNILSVNDELTQKTTYWDSTFEPLLSRDFDLILIESFGYNPLSSLGIEGGIKRQNQALDELMKTIITTPSSLCYRFRCNYCAKQKDLCKKSSSEYSHHG